MLAQTHGTTPINKTNSAKPCPKLSKNFDSETALVMPRVVNRDTGAILTECNIVIEAQECAVIVAQVPSPGMWGMPLT
jgi:hypothetical protein